MCKTVHMKNLIVNTEFGSVIYKSIAAASEQTGISRTRISRALNHHPYGLIANSEPPVCVEIFEESQENRPQSLPCMECMKCPYLRGDNG